MHHSNNILYVILFSALIVAMITDIKRQKIYNWLTGSMFCTAIVVHMVTNGFDGFVFSIKGLLVGTCLLIIPFILGGMGAGDSKLMAAVGSILGAKGVFYSFIFTGLFGGIYSVLIILFHKKHFQGILKRYLIKFYTLLFARIYIPDPDPPVTDSPKLCYGVAIGFGTITYMGLILSGFHFPF